MYSPVFLSNPTTSGSPPVLSISLRDHSFSVLASSFACTLAHSRPLWRFLFFSKRAFNASSSCSRCSGNESFLLLLMFRALVALIVVASRVSYLLLRCAPPHGFCFGLSLRSYQFAVSTSFGVHPSVHPRSPPPGEDACVPSFPSRHRRAIAAMTSFTDYRDNFRIADFPAAVVNEADTWDPGSNALRFVAGKYSSEWSYKGDTMNLTVASPQLSYAVRLTGAGQVMYAKDKLGIEGFIQEGAHEDRSYYYSLPRVQIEGRITYTGKSGLRREIDVTGQGWVDRQWGDFLTKSWEWSSLRFSNVARVN